MTTLPCKRLIYAVSVYFLYRNPVIYTFKKSISPTHLRHTHKSVYSTFLLHVHVDFIERKLTVFPQNRKPKIQED